MSRSEWTPDLVVDRLVRGLHIAIRSESGRVGPAGCANSMPEYVREFSDKVRSFKEALEEFLAEVELIGSRRFPADEIAKANEALRWPVRYFPGNEHPNSLLRDALWIRMVSGATKETIEGLLRRRCEKANAMLEYRRRYEPDTVRIYEDDAQDIAARLAAWATEAMAKPLEEAMIARLKAEKKAQLRRAKRRVRGAVDLTPEDIREALGRRNGRIKQAARIRFAREIRAAKAIERITRHRRQDVIEGKIFSPRMFYEYQYRASVRLADALSADMVPVR